MATSTFIPKATTTYVGTTDQVEIPQTEIANNISPDFNNPINQTETIKEAERNDVNKNLTQDSQNKLPPYIVQPGTPSASVNFLKPEMGCNWLGVVGQAFDKNNQPVSRLIVEVDGVLEGRTLLLLGLSGGAPDLGQGGYELMLSDHPVESHGSLWIQLFDIYGIPQSKKIFFDTYGDCNRNLIMINFNEMGASLTPMFYTPLIRR
jgi:hypothetical protein